MPLTSSGIWYPDGNFTANPRVIAAQQAANLESVITTERLHHGSTEYATSAARDLANPTPVQGDQCTILGVPYTYITGSGWVQTKTMKTPLAVSTARKSISWSAVSSTTAIQQFTETLPEMSYAAIVGVNVNTVGTISGGGYGNIMVLQNGAIVLGIRQVTTNHEVSGSVWMAWPANTTLTISLTVSVNSAAASSTVTANITYNYIQWAVIPV